MPGDGGLPTPPGTPWERGTHPDLMRLGGFYAELVGHQSVGSERTEFAMLAAQ